MARQIGWSEDEIAALHDASRREIFPEPLRVALTYAELMTRDAHTVTDAFFAELKTHYSDSQILELTCVVGLTNYWNRFTSALKIDKSGTDEPYDQ